MPNVYDLHQLQEMEPLQYTALRTENLVNEITVTQSPSSSLSLTRRRPLRELRFRNPSQWGSIDAAVNLKGPSILGRHSQYPTCRSSSSINHISISSPNVGTGSRIEKRKMKKQNFSFEIKTSISLDLEDLKNVDVKPVTNINDDSMLDFEVVDHIDVEYDSDIDSDGEAGDLIARNLHLLPQHSAYDRLLSAAASGFHDSGEVTSATNTVTTNTYLSEPAPTSNFKLLTATSQRESSPSSGSNYTSGRSISTSYRSIERMDNYSNPSSSLFGSPRPRHHIPRASQSLSPLPRSVLLDPTASEDGGDIDFDGLDIKSTYSGSMNMNPQSLSPRSRCGAAVRRIETPLSHMRLSQTLDRCVARCGISTMQEILEYLIREDDGIRKVKAVINTAASADFYDH